VFLADDTQLGRKVAIKFVTEALESDPTARERLHREARSAAAPEQLLGGQTDTRSDIFTFGILLYEMLAGVHPFHRTSQSGTMAAIWRDTPAPITQYQGALPTRRRRRSTGCWRRSRTGGISRSQRCAPT